MRNRIALNRCDPPPRTRYRRINFRTRHGEGHYRDRNNCGPWRIKRGDRGSQFLACPYPIVVVVVTSTSNSVSRARGPPVKSDFEYLWLTRTNFARFAIILFARKLEKSGLRKFPIDNRSVCRRRQWKQRNLISARSGSLSSRSLESLEIDEIRFRAVPSAVQHVC